MNKFFQPRVLCFVALTTLIASGEPAKTETLVRQLGGPAVVKMVQIATDVKIVRLASPKFSKSERAAIREAAAKETDRAVKWAMEVSLLHPEAYAPVSLAPEHIVWIKGKIVLPELYTPPSALGKGCDFIPGVKISFSGPEGEVQFLFCFGCKDVMVQHNRRIIGGADFEPSRKMWADSFKVFLPNDSEIAKLY